MEPGMFDGLIVKGALMAIGGGAGAIILTIVGWGIVQFVLAKYGKKKNGNGDKEEKLNYVTPETCIAHHEEVKDLIRDEFERVREKTADEFAQVKEDIKEDIKEIYDRVWEHSTDHVAHGGR